MLVTFYFMSFLEVKYTNRVLLGSLNRQEVNESLGICAAILFRGTHLKGKCIESICIDINIFGINPKMTHHLTSHTFPNPTSWLLMRGDDLVIYDPFLGSEQTVFIPQLVCP